MRPNKAQAKQTKPSWTTLERKKVLQRQGGNKTNPAEVSEHDAMKLDTDHRQLREPQQRHCFMRDTPERNYIMIAIVSKGY